MDEYIVCPVGDRQTLIRWSDDSFEIVATLPTIGLDRTVVVGWDYFASLAASASAVVTGSWTRRGRLVDVAAIELPPKVEGICLAFDGDDRLFVGGKRDADPWLGYVDLVGRERTWCEIMLSDSTGFWSRKGIDALLYLSDRQSLYAFDNVEAPLYVWIIDFANGMALSRTTIDPVYTYERIQHVAASTDNLLIITSGVSRSNSMQFARLFDLGMKERGVLHEEMEKERSWEPDSETQTYERGDEWSGGALCGEWALLAGGGRGVCAVPLDGVRQPTYYVFRNGGERAIRVFARGAQFAVVFDNGGDSASPPHLRYDIGVFEAADLIGGCLTPRFVLPTEGATGSNLTSE